jgi:hypothetical protein
MLLGFDPARRAVSKARRARVFGDVNGGSGFNSGPKLGGKYRLPA